MAVRVADLQAVQEQLLAAKTALYEARERETALVSSLARALVHVAVVLSRSRSSSARAAECATEDERRKAARF